MREANTNLTEWMWEAAHARTGTSFQYNAYNCMPVITEENEHQALAFLLSKDSELLLVHENAQLAEHRQVWDDLKNIYLKKGMSSTEFAQALPSETWFG